MPYRLFFQLCTGLLIITTAAAQETKVAPSNFLIIMADDCTYNDLPIYGGKNALTPNIDRLATEGLVFNRAYLTTAMCQPCRSELYTGLFPMRNGSAWNHSASLTDTVSMPQYLKAQGYRVGIAGKVHVTPKASFPFTKVDGYPAKQVRTPTEVYNVDGIRDFMAKQEEQPFCLVVALTEPHSPWVMGNSSAYPPEKIDLPENLADTKVTRENFSRYLAEITYMDGQVGEILKVLEESGQADDTLVLFTSEQGSQFPGSKWTNWDTGLHTGLIARWPGTISPGQRTDAMVHYADVLPTLLDIANPFGQEGDFDGSSFLSVLTDAKTTHRKFVYGMHNNVPEGPPYPIRSVSDGTHHYIRNLLPDEIYIEKHLIQQRDNGYWITWMGEAWKNPRTYDLVKRFTHRPVEELYNTPNDPFEMTNIVNESNNADIKSRLSAELDRWMKEQGDPGAAMDTHEAHQAAKKGQHIHGRTQ